ncbi:uncharacterized protein isoform X2 [Rhodnius prolixus]
MAIEDQVLKAENELYLLCLKEHHFNEDKYKEIQELNIRIKKERLEVDEKKRLMQEQIKKIKAIQLVKERYESATKAAKKLENLPCEIKPEFLNKIKPVANDISQRMSSLELRNFAPITKAEEDEIVNDFKDMSDIMLKVEENIKAVNVDKTSCQLSNLEKKLNNIKNITGMSHEKEVKVNDLMLMYMSLKLGERSEMN